MGTYLLNSSPSVKTTEPSNEPDRKTRRFYEVYCYKPNSEVLVSVSRTFLRHVIRGFTILLLHPIKQALWYFPGEGNYGKFINISGG